MDAAIEENVQHMDISEANKDQTQEPKNEIICEPGPSNAGTPEAELVINEPEVPKSPVKEKCKTPDKNDCIYHIKWISRNGCKSPVITQNENGPCPLIAIMNLLIMKGRVTLPSLVDIVTTEKLMEYLGDCILDSIPKNIPPGAQLNYEQNIHDAMAVLPKLQTGLDVNVKFTGISDFEYTPECIIFDLLRIPLYHGWLIDPQMTDVVQAVGKCSYNQLVEKIINLKSSLDSDNVTEALIAESFLQKTASQLTYHGLYELTSRLKEGELCVLFRNNHFSSLIKHNNCLYQLVTDQGFLNENVVWETLNNIEGDAEFVDSDFILVPPKASVPLPPNVTPEQQIDQDLQEEQQKQQSSELEWEDYKKEKLGISNGLTDEELALRLQEEENRSLDNQRNQPKSSPPASRNRSRDKSGRKAAHLKKKSKLCQSCNVSFSKDEHHYSLRNIASLPDYRHISCRISPLPGFCSADTHILTVSKSCIAKKAPFFFSFLSELAQSKDISILNRFQWNVIKKKCF